MKTESTQKPQLAKLIEMGFSHGATTYDAHVQVQTFACDNLAAYVAASDVKSATGPLLEIGCGTGLLSEQLLRLFPNQLLSFLDISENMIARTKSRLEKLIDHDSAALTFLVADGEAFFTTAETENSPAEYSTIVSSFTFQWFNELEQTISNIIEHLTSGGRLYFSIPSEGTFAEWQAISTELGLPFTANPLPKATLFFSIAEKLKCQFDMQELHFCEHYNNSLDFFYSLKKIGANTSTRLPEDSLTPTQLRKLVKHWNRNKGAKNQIKVTYRIIQGCFTKIK